MTGSASTPKDSAERERRQRRAGSPRACRPGGRCWQPARRKLTICACQVVTTGRRRRSSCGAGRSRWTSPTASTGTSTGTSSRPRRPTCSRRRRAGAVGRGGSGSCARRRRASTRGELQALASCGRRCTVVFSAIARAREPPGDELDVLAAEHAAAAAAGRLAPGDGAWRLRLAGRRRRARSASPSPPTRWALLGRRRRGSRACTRCPGRDCGWLFLDASGRRRWCSMGACGSREKMRRMYARRHP